MSSKFPNTRCISSLNYGFQNFIVYLSFITLFKRILYPVLNNKLSKCAPHSLQIQHGRPHCVRTWTYFHSESKKVFIGNVILQQEDFHNPYLVLRTFFSLLFIFLQYKYLQFLFFVFLSYFISIFNFLFLVPKTIHFNNNGQQFYLLFSFLH